MEGDRNVAIEEDAFTYEWVAQIEKDTFFRAEVVDQPEPPHEVMRALSNPIYVLAREGD
jgi:hypothetical protein